jgi:MFS family permease
VTGTLSACLLISFAALYAGAHSAIWLVAGALLMDACSQGIHVTNQAVIYDLVDAARARVTTVYMTTYFAGGAIGTTTGTLAYHRAGWTGATATVCCMITLLGWLAARRHEHPSPASTHPHRP